MYEGSLCVCCMSTDELVQLFGCKNENGEEENYAKLLAACLNIKLAEDEGHDAICDNCVTTLKTCVGFKKQVLKSISILSSVELKDLIDEEEMQVLNLGILKNSDLESELKIHSAKPGCAINDIQLQISPRSADWDRRSDKEQRSKFKTVKQNRETAIFKVTKQVKDKKPTRGRPRIHPPDKKMPYDIGSDELVCRECGETFPNNVTLKVHYNKHFGQHKCTVCSKSFITRSSLSKHKRSHLRGPFKCFDCDQVFRSINSLNSHKRFKHSEALPYKCQVKDCGQRFATITRRLQHLATKHRIVDYNYHCKYCLKKFRTSSERAKHISSRHEVRYFSCPVCGVRCRQATLRSHLRSHLGGDGGKKVTNDERRFVCKLCSREFGQKKTLVYHIGSHVRHGDYAGDTNFLILDKRAQKNNYGILSEDKQEQRLDETILSDELDDFENVDNIDGDIDRNMVDNIDIDNLDIDFIEKSLQSTDSGEIDELCTDLAFNTPEYNK